MFFYERNSLISNCVYRRLWSDTSFIIVPHYFPFTFYWTSNYYIDGDDLFEFVCLSRTRLWQRKQTTTAQWWWWWVGDGGDNNGISTPYRLWRNGTHLISFSFYFYYGRLAALFWYQSNEKREKLGILTSFNFIDEFGLDWRQWWCASELNEERKRSNFFFFREQFND
jgi:hypothetical protein